MCVAAPKWSVEMVKAVSSSWCCTRKAAANKTVAADALFVLIGADPHTDWLRPDIARDPNGFLLTGEELSDDFNWSLERRPYSLETSMPGVFAAGDVRRSSVKRVASTVERAPSRSARPNTPRRRAAGCRRSEQPRYWSRTRSFALPGK